MRTITATRTTAEEAEAVRRRLEEIGVAPERIAFRELDDPAGDAERGIFISAKVLPAQVASATEILNEREAEASAPAETFDDAGETPAAEAAQIVTERPTIGRSEDVGESTRRGGAPFASPAEQKEEPDPRLTESESGAQKAAHPAGSLPRGLRLALLFALASAIGILGGYLLGQIIY